MGEAAASPGSQRVEAIRDDVACPSCSYNLRGLTGDVVPCPECGTRCDIAKLVARRWLGPWYHAPGFNTLLMPTFVVGIAPLMMLLAGGGAWGIGKVGSPARAIAWISVVALIAAMWWLFTMMRAYRLFGNRRGPLLALLAHAILIGYLVSVFAMLSVILAVLAMTQRNWIPALSGMGLGVIGIALGWSCRRGERWIAEQCIRRYLADPATAIPAKDHR